MQIRITRGIIIKIWSDGMNEYTLRDLQLKELECLKEIDRVCKKYEIEYMLAWGSAIGAIRHHGFIPWDDDIDLVIKSKDVKRLKEAFKKENNPDYFFQDWQSDPYTTSWFPKIRMNRTTSMNRELQDYPMHSGICIDLFPLLPYKQDHLNRFDAFLAKLIVFFNAKRINDANHGAFVYENKKLKYFPVFFCDFMRSISYKILTRSRNEEKCTYYLVDGHHVFDLALKKEYFDQIIEVPFEDGMFPINAGYDAFLRSYYGDYMQVPEVSERRNHGDLIIDLHKDYTAYLKG